MADIPQTPGPICNAINAQFDAWDTQIEDLKNKSREAAKEQAEKIKKDIKDYQKKKEDELSDQQNKTNPKYETASTISGLSAPTTPDEAVSTVQSILTFIQDMANLLMATASDLAKAPVVLGDRATQSLDKLAEV